MTAQKLHTIKFFTVLSFLTRQKLYRIEDPLCQLSLHYPMWENTQISKYHNILYELCIYSWRGGGGGVVVVFTCPGCWGRFRWCSWSRSPCSAPPLAPSRTGTPFCRREWRSNWPFYRGILYNVHMYSSSPIWVAHVVSPPTCEYFQPHLGLMNSFFSTKCWCLGNKSTL